MLNVNPRLFAIYYACPEPVRSTIASMYAWWSGIFKFGPEYWRWLKFLEESQWWTEAQVRDYQIRQLRDFLTLAGELSPFYGELFRARSFDPSTLTSLNELERLPIIDRLTVKQHHQNIRTPFARYRRLVLATSGTTGASLQVPMTPDVMQREYAFRSRFIRMGGAQKGDRIAFFTGHVVKPVDDIRPPFHIRNYAENSIMFSVYHMSDTMLSSYVDALNTFRPKYLYGYPSAIYVLASYVERFHPRIVQRPAAVFVSSETLHDEQRTVIERAFGAPVFQWYGQMETTINIQECSHHKLHVMEEYGYLEILRSDGSHALPGESGDAVGTGWGNPAFPLIRYRTGDRVVLASNQRCACGSQGRILERILGRDDDFIVTPDGRYIQRLGFVFRSIQTVKESQIVQDSINHVTVRLVPLPGYSAHDEVLIREKLHERIGKGFSVSIQVLETLPRSKRGKFRYVISEIDIPQAMVSRLPGTFAA
jgi:phenylacetate-CoA ligase